jgi:hypothetical protein
VRQSASELCQSRKGGGIIFERSSEGRSDVGGGDDGPLDSSEDIVLCWGVPQGLRSKNDVGNLTHKIFTTWQYALLE